MCCHKGASGSIYLTKILFTRTVWRWKIKWHCQPSVWIKTNRWQITSVTFFSTFPTIHTRRCGSFYNNYRSAWTTRSKAALVFMFFCVLLVSPWTTPINYRIITCRFPRFRWFSPSSCRRCHGFSNQTNKMYENLYFITEANFSKKNTPTKENEGSRLWEQTNIY